MDELTMIDGFCGGGGSTTGALQVPGVSVTCAINHWDRAIETHAWNHPQVDHLLADMAGVDPRRVPRTDMAWFSPECTWHSQARGERNWAAPDLFGETLPPEAAVRSRMTMWEVVRFAEQHRYRAVIVENVVQIADWDDAGIGRGGSWRAWLAAMRNLGYHHRVLSLNSMHAQLAGPPAPQSRDRTYVVFWRDGCRAPDLERVIRPRAWCPRCDTLVDARQAWKHPSPDRPGRYRQQYVYACPRCGREVEPAWLPAATIIDWDDPGQRISDRARPLADKTLRRIQAGIERYWAPLVIEAAGNTWDAAAGAPGSYLRAWPVDEPLRTVHATNSKAIVIPVEGRNGKNAADADGPQRTVTTRAETGLAFPPLIAELRGGHSGCRPTLEPLATVTAGGNHHALIVTNTHHDRARPVSEPAPTSTTATGGGQALVMAYYGHGQPQHTGLALPTVTTRDRFALLMRNQTSPGEPAWLSTPVHQPARTLTASGNQSLLTAPSPTIDVGDVWFRMVKPVETKRAMAFPTAYRLLGTNREQTRLAGNAVTPPCARDIVTVVAAALTGTVAS